MLKLRPNGNKICIKRKYKFICVLRLANIWHFYQITFCYRHCTYNLGQPNNTSLTLCNLASFTFWVRSISSRPIICGLFLFLLGSSYEEAIVFIQNAVAIMENIPLTSISVKHILPMRKYAIRFLMDNGVPPTNEMSKCDFITCQCEGKKRRYRWIYCDCCGRWLHYACINMKRAPRGPYVCIICNSEFS